MEKNLPDALKAHRAGESEQHVDRTGPQGYLGESRDHKAPLTFQRTRRASAATEEVAKPKSWLLCHP